MSISHWLDESINAKTLKYDAVIIGAGIAGLSTAYWLEKKDPTLKIAVIERDDLGFGASGRNAGFITCGSAEHFHKLSLEFGFAKALEIWKFSEENRQQLLAEIIQDDFASVDYLSTGSCTVAASEADWQRYQALNQKMRAGGIDVDLINEEDLLRNYGVRHFQGAIQYRHDGVIHPLKLLKKMKSFLRRTDFFFGEEVFAFEEHQVRTQKNKFSTEKIFLALNSYVSQLLPELQKQVVPQRGQILMTAPLPPFVKGPCYLTKHLCYFRQLTTGELLVGGFRNQDLTAESTFVDQTTEKVQQALTDFTLNYFQQTQAVKIEKRWSGIMGFTADGQMLIGAHPTLASVYLMAGCSGHGMGLSFNAARMLVGKSFGQDLPSHLDLQRIFN